MLKGKFSKFVSLGAICYKLETNYEVHLILHVLINFNVYALAHLW